MVNTPIPHSLKSEAKKAAKILREFTIPNAKTGPDKLIPAGILLKAKGLAIITVFKAGFLVTARGGSGIVIAKMNDDPESGEWSAPSAIALAGLGGGFEIGMEVTDFVIILNTRSAVDAFSKGGNLTLGGNFTIAAGPLGRNLEGDIAIRSPAAIYTYSKTKGIFAGISVEGSALIERKDANKKFYGREVRAFQILNGEVDRPDECQALYEVLREHHDIAISAVVKMAKNQASKYVEGERSSESRPRFYDSFNFKSKKSDSQSATPPKFPLSRPTTTTSKPAASSTTSAAAKDPWLEADMKQQPSAEATQQSLYPWSDMDRMKSSHSEPSRKSSLDEKFYVIAEFNFDGQLPCDLKFSAGDKIQVTKSTPSQHDWWEGVDRRGNKGIFPANFVSRA